jgi:hypothetical protein
MKLGALAAADSNDKYFSSMLPEKLDRKTASVGWVSQMDKSHTHQQILIS